MLFGQLHISVEPLLTMPNLQPGEAAVNRPLE